MLISIIIPTLDEVENIDPLFERVFEALAGAEYDAEVVVVDDGSTDGTRARVRAWSDEHPVRLIERDHERGLSGAVLAGADAAHGDVVVVMDADLSHPPERIGALVEPILAGRSDMVVGSRYVPGGSTPGWPFLRRVASRAASWLAWPLVDIRDPMSGFFAVRRERLRSASLDAKGFKIGLEVMMAGGEALRVSEISIVFHDRAHGQSKLDSRVLLEYLDRLRVFAGGAVSTRTATRFATVGFLGMLVDLLVYQTLLSIGWFFNASHLTSFLAATVFNFFLHMRWSFSCVQPAAQAVGSSASPRHCHNERLPGARSAADADLRQAGSSTFSGALSGWRRYARFLTVAILALTLRGAVLGMLVEGIGLTPRLAILAAIGAVAMVNYLGNTFYVFPLVSRASREDLRWRVATIGIVGFLLALRVLYIGLPDLMMEEAYYWNYAQHPALSYLDHPPMVAWLIWLGTAIVGQSEAGVRIGAILCGVLTAWFVYHLTKEQRDKSTAFPAVLLVSALPFFFMASLLMTPDAPLTAMWAGALLFLHRALIQGRERAWWGVGIFAGLGLLSKYTILLLGPATLLFLLLDPPSRRWLRNPRPYAAAALAAAIFSPVILWNARNEWASFAFQTVDRVSEKAMFGLPNLIGAVLLLITPLSVAAMAQAAWSRRSGRSLPGAGAWESHVNASRVRLFAAVFTLAPLAVFVLFSMRHHPKLNWTGPLWIASIPVIAGALVHAEGVRASLLARGSRAIWAPVIILCMMVYAAGLYYVSFGFPGVGYPERFRFVGWRQLIAQVELVEETVEAQEQIEPLVVGMDKYGLASLLAFYRTVAESGYASHNPAEGVTHTASQNIIDGPGLMYERWFLSKAQNGVPMILVAAKAHVLTDANLRPHFERLTEISQFSYVLHGRSLDDYYYRIGYGFKAPGAPRVTNHP